MNVRRSLSSIVAVAGVVALLAACGGGDDKKTTPTSVPPTATVANTVAPTAPPQPTATTAPASPTAAPSTPVPSTPVVTGTPVAVNVILTDFRISVFTTSLTAGTAYSFTIQNNGAVPHGFVIEPVGANNQPLTRDGASAAVAEIAPGQSATLTWVFTEAGTFQLASHLNDDFAQGMVQANVVVTN